MEGAFERVVPKVTTTTIVVFKEDGVAELVTDGAGVRTIVVNCSGAVGEKD